MTTLTVRIENLDQLRANFGRAPQRALHWLSAATRAAIFEIEKQAIDPNFQFKTPRGMRTGYLSLSFGFGRRFDPSGLRASIGPTAHYAIYVHEGTQRGIRPNRFMDRIAAAAEPGVGKQFEKAVDSFVGELARI